MQLLAFFGYSGFLVATFGWRTVQAKRTSGESGFRGPVSRIDAIGESACLVACSLSLVAPLLATARLFEPVEVELVAVRLILSSILTGLGTALAIWAQRQLDAEWRAGVEASGSLVTAGPFARVRNPFYLGWFLASAAVVVAVPSLAALAGLALHVVAAEVIVRWVEEPILSRAHGADFVRYQQRTGRFLPRGTG